MEYYSGYSTPEWKAKRLKILLRDHYRCAICQRITDNPQVHHISYLNSTNENTFLEPWKANDEQLITLCREHHECFWGTKCKTRDYIFLPASPCPILLKRHDQHPEHEEFWSILDIMIPDWDDEYKILLKYQYKNNWCLPYQYQTNLIVALLYPETSKLWKKLNGETIEGYDEIEEFLYYSYFDVKEIKYFDSKIKSMVAICNSLVVNYNYMHKQFEVALLNSKTRPSSGYIIKTRNNKKERNFTLYDIENNCTIILEDFSNDVEFKQIPITTANEIGTLYAYAYLNTNSEDCSSYIESPIFLDNSTGISSVRSILLKENLCIDDKLFEQYFSNIPERIRHHFANYFKRIKNYKKCRIFEWNKQWNVGGV